MSPSASTSGWPGRVRSGPDGDARRRDRPRAPASPASSRGEPGGGDAGGPDRGARRRRARPRRRGSRIATEPAVDVDDGVAGERRDAELLERVRRLPRERLGEAREDAVAVLDEQDPRRRACRLERKSRRSVSRASSAICPAISTPVGPAPTTTKVSQLRRRAGSGSISAASNAPRIAAADVERALERLQLGRVRRAHSSWPKYEYCEPPATIRRVVAERSPARRRSAGRRAATSRRSRSKPVTSAEHDAGVPLPLDDHVAAAPRSRPARARPSPPGRRAAGRACSSAGRRASPRPVRGAGRAPPAGPAKPPPTTTTRCVAMRAHAATASSSPGLLAPSAATKSRSRISTNETTAAAKATQRADQQDRVQAVDERRAGGRRDRVRAAARASTAIACGAPPVETACAITCACAARGVPLSPCRPPTSARARRESCRAPRRRSRCRPGAGSS